MRFNFHYSNVRRAYEYGRPNVELYIVKDFNRSTSWQDFYYVNTIGLDGVPEDQLGDKGR